MHEMDSFIKKCVDIDEDGVWNQASDQEPAFKFYEEDLMEQLKETYAQSGIY